MSSKLSPKETKAILDDLERQGCKLKQTKSGVMVLFPNGGSTSFHWSPSDHRGTLNKRAEIKRAGLSWLGDIQRKQEDEMTGGIRAKGSGVRGRPLDEDQLAALKAFSERLAREGKVWAPISQIANEAGVSHGAVVRRLRREGWESSANGREWHKVEPMQAAPTSDYPEIEKAKALASTDNPGSGHQRLHFQQPAPVAATAVEVVAKPAEPEKVAVVPEPKMPTAAQLTPPVKRLTTHLPDAGKLVSPNGKTSWPVTIKHHDDCDEVHLEGEGQVVDEKPAAPEKPKREFIDSVDSWTVAVPDKLARMAEQLGLSIEVRVWRA